MRRNKWIRGALIALAAASLVWPQQPPPNTQVPPGFFPRPLPQQPPAPVAPKPDPAKPGAPATGTAPQSTAPAQTSAPTSFGGLSLSNASLTEVIDLLARQLKLNYILDPRVRGGVILNTYGETKDIDTRSLLETILRVNGFGMVKQGDLYRIVPLSDISHLPIPPEVDAKNIPEDDRTMLNLVFLKYVTVDELAKVLEPFIGENSRMFAYTPANLLLLLDSRRNMHRTMELISLFDSDSLANQRVRMFEVKNGRPSDLAKELDTIAKSISLSEKNAPIKFLAVDRINAIIAVAPNPGAFIEVEKWLTRLDIPLKVTAGAVSNYVYRVRYADAQSIGCSIQALFGQMSGYGGQGAIAACVAASGGPFGGGGGAFGGGGGGGGLYGGGGGPYSGAFGGGQYAGGQYGGQYGQAGPPMATNPFGQAIPPQAQNQTSTGAADLTGTFLGNAPAGGQQQQRQPRVVANPFNNTLLIQASPQDYENILTLLKDLDVPPRQVLIEAKIYSIDLKHAFSTDVQAKLQQL
ncbi:MAG TPA: secretin N-terminal domain-containing protein, partial [Bryobacteraceae bacterium]